MDVFDIQATKRVRCGALMVLVIWDMHIEGSRIFHTPVLCLVQNPVSRGPPTTFYMFRFNKFDQFSQFGFLCSRFIVYVVYVGLCVLCLFCSYFAVIFMWAYQICVAVLHLHLWWYYFELKVWKEIGNINKVMIIRHPLHRLVSAFHYLFTVNHRRIS